MARPLAARVFRACVGTWVRLAIRGYKAMFKYNQPEFNGFQDYYYDRIFPYLLSQEQGRKSQVRKTIVAVSMLAVVLTIATILVYMKFRAVKPTFGVALMSFGACVMAMQYGLAKFRSATKDFLMEAFGEYLGWDYQAELNSEPNLSPWLDNRLLPKYDDAKFEDLIRGHIHGADFTLFEAELERETSSGKGGKQKTTVFRGMLLEIDFHKKFMGKTVVLRDKGLFNKKQFAGMKRVGLVDPVFEKLFEAYGTDQVEARVLLHPSYMQRLIDLETLVNGKKTRFGFWDGKLYIAIEVKSQFEAGSMFKPLTDTERTQKILSELEGVFRLVDGVLEPSRQYGV